MLVGPAKVFFMDEISTGLDSSTTFQLCKFLRQMIHTMEVTMLISLLQPAPETYELFDDIILLSEGQIVYQGPREHVLEFFENMGFKCPERKGVADFLQEVTSKKDQQQYWSRRNEPYRYVSVPEFAGSFHLFYVGKKLASEIKVPYDKSQTNEAALVKKKYDNIKPWMIWGYYISPMMYGQNAIVINEFLDERWSQPNTDPRIGATTVGKEMKNQGINEDRLQLLRDVSGAFRPGILTALMGVSGAGKTTLLDVLVGRKTGGYIEGSISISGHLKNQATYARVSGYCEQNDIHSPYVTVYESLLFSAWLRLPSHVNTQTRKMFVEEVMEWVELKPIKDALVGLPGIDGLSTEQRKRLTIAVELVANPSIILMDEPTSGLDARAAAIVMRTVRKTVDTGRTVVCTIHQPSIDIFEAFDEAIAGIQKIKDGYNPATWMLDISTPSMEAQLDIDFAKIYVNSTLYHQKQQDLFDLLGAMFSTVMFLGTMNAVGVQPVVDIERTVLYRERAAGMYSALPYALGQEIPVWWRWFYWATPNAWTIYGLVTSQLGDEIAQIDVPGAKSMGLKELLKENMGFDYDFLPVVAIVHVGWVIIFLFLFVFGVKFLNFQKR
ncbi:hypothetical protein JHK87_007787 [Glycine soja]|nr:hypothetical protein JHK87_007787 [Glycine soja]